jgi:hypothetical protein
MLTNSAATSFRRGEACSFNSDVNNSRDGIISYQERQCIKTALAFVVLRRRAAVRCAQRNSKPRQLSLVSSELFSSQSLRNSAQNDRKAGSIIGIVEHLQSMMRVAMATAIPLYEHVVIHSLDDIVSSAASKRIEQEAIIYDYIAASSKLGPYGDSNSSSSKALSIYKILDGILQHVASQLTTKKRIARDDGVDSAASETEMNNYFSEILELTKTTATHKELNEINVSSNTTSISAEEQSRSLLLILSTCTVFHRLVYWNVEISIPIVCTVCKFINKEYHNNTSQIPYVSDVFFVNLLTLLEGILERIHTICVTESTNKAIGRKILSVILSIFQLEIGELIVPIPIDEMAKFYYEEDKQHNLSLGTASTGTSTSSKLLIRLALYNVVQRISSLLIAH